MDVESQLYTRQNIAARTGVDDSVLNYWMREGVLRAAAGGSGRGNRRRFSFHEVNLAAIFSRLAGAGFSISALRDLAETFHSAIDYHAQFNISKSEREDLFSILVDRKRFLELGYYPWKVKGPEEWPDKTRFPPHYMLDSPYVDRIDRNEIRLTWEEGIAAGRQARISEQWKSSPWTDDLIDIAEKEDPETWLRHYHNFSTISSVPERLYSSSELYYFYRDSDGRWTISANTDAVRSGVDTFIALDTDLIFWRVWHPDADGVRPPDGYTVEGKAE